MAPIVPPAARSGPSSRFNMAHDATIDKILKTNAAALGEGAGAVFFVKRTLDQLSSKMPDDPSPSDVVYEHINDLRCLDSNPRTNMASFCTTQMEEPAKKLIMDSLNVNQIDGNIYASSRDIEGRCVQMLADVFHAPPDDYKGTATVGSTEACLLGGLNLKKRWEDARRAKGLPTTKPNIIISAAYQVCWKKFSVYHDVEMRLGHLEVGVYTLVPEEVERLADENTIGVAAILGSTYTGHYDDIKALSETCERLHATKGLDLHIHVDAASGGFVAPFLMPNLVWDFRLPRVLSISCSGHKSGLVFPGVGWFILRSEAALHSSMVFHLGYLGVEQEDFTLNFSRPAAMIIGQYYMLLRMGRRGYELVAHATTEVTKYLYTALEAMGMVMHSAKAGTGQPLVVFELPPLAAPAPEGVSGTVATARRAAAIKEEVGDAADGAGPERVHERPYTCFELSFKLRERGWSVPAYKLAPNLDHIQVMRLVVRAEFSMLLADALLKDIRESMEYLDAHYANLTRVDRDHIAESMKHLHPVAAPSVQAKLKHQSTVC